MSESGGAESSPARPLPTLPEVLSAGGVVAWLGLGQRGT